MKNSTFRKKTFNVLVFNCLFTNHYNSDGKKKINYLKDETILELDDFGQPIKERKVDYPIFLSITKSASFLKSSGVNKLNMIKFFLS